MSVPMSPLNANLTLDLAEDEDLVAIATIAITSAGEIKLHLADVAGAAVTMTAAQKAHALRMLATAVEAEAIAATPTPS
jgi:hypothetical protein